MIGTKVALLHALTGTLVPLFVLALMTRFFGQNRSFQEGLQVWKFALFAAFAMTLPYLTVAYLLGPEFPSLFGGLIGLVLVGTAAKRGFLVPAPEKHWDFESSDRWDSEWTGEFELPEDRDGTEKMGMVVAWSPYLLVALLLVLTRLRDLPFYELVNAWSISLPNLFGTEISAAVRPLYLPGSIFVFVSLLTFLLHRMDWSSYGRAWRRSLRTLIAASTALVFTVPMVQVFINSGSGGAGFDKMPIVLADGVAALVGSAWPIFAPFIGGLGAFVAGSNTVSNMMFSLFQFGVGQRIGVDPTWIVALQAVGGAAGNMICVHNVVAASAVVGLLGREGAVIRKTLIPFSYYALLPGSIGYAIVWYSQKGIVNLGTVLVVAIAAVVVCLIAKSSRS